MRKDQNTFRSLLHSGDLLEKRMTTLLSPLGVRPRQARVLNALSRMGEVTQSALIDSFDITSGSMSTMIDRLVARGFVQRRKHPDDRRSDLLSLTDDGRLVLAEVKDVWREMDDLVQAKLGPEKAAQLADLTRELKFALGAKVPASNKGVAAARQASMTVNTLIAPDAKY